MIAFINVAVFLGTLLVGFILGSNSGYKQAMDVFKPILEAIGTVLEEITKEESENEMSVDEDY